MDEAPPLETGEAQDSARSSSSRGSGRSSSPSSGAQRTSLSKRLSGAIGRRLSGRRARQATAAPQAVTAAWLSGLADRLLAGDLLPELELGLLESGRTAELVKGEREGETLTRELCWPGLAEEAEPTSAQVSANKSRAEWTARDVAALIARGLLEPEYAPAAAGAGGAAESKLVWVVHAHDTPFCDMARGLLEHCGAEAALWLDFCCPATLRPAGPLEARAALAAKAGAAVLYIGKWSAPLPLSRMWCAWELFAALQAGLEPQVVCAPGWEADLASTAREKHKALVQACTGISCAATESANEEERGSLLTALAAASPQGLFGVNQRLAEFLGSKLVDALQAMVSERREDLRRPSLLTHAGAILGELHRDEMALEMHKEALEMQRERKSKRTRIAKTLQTMADCCHKQGRRKDALKYACEALGLLQQRLGKDSVRVAQALNAVGNLHSEMGDFGAALDKYEESLEILVRVCGEGDLRTAQARHNLGIFYLGQRDFASAEAACQRALAARRDKLGASDPKVAATLLTLGEIHRAQGSWDAAMEQYESALGMLWERSGGPAAVIELIFAPDADWRSLLAEVGRCVFQQPLDLLALHVCKRAGAIHAARGDLERGLVTYSFTLALAKARLGDRHELVGNLLEGIALLFDHLGAKPEAYALVRAASAPMKSAV